MSKLSRAVRTQTTFFQRKTNITSLCLSLRTPRLVIPGSVSLRSARDGAGSGGLSCRVRCSHRSSACMRLATYLKTPSNPMVVVQADLNGEKDWGLVSKGSFGVRISNLRSLSLVINTKPKRGSLSACQPSRPRRSMVLVMACKRSAPHSRRWLSIICHCNPNTASQRGVVDFS